MSNTKLSQLIETIRLHTSSWGGALISRQHQLNSLPNTWIKRDDELSFGISGNKYRKLASLVHHWKTERIEKVIAIGSSSSNHIVACLQVFHELGLDYELWLLEGHHLPDTPSNAGYIKLLSRKDKIKWISRDRWPDVIKDAQSHQERSSSTKHFVMQEGGCQLQALWGAMSLGVDLLENQSLETFKHIVIDSGTGLSAAALAIFLDYCRYQGQLHIIQMAPLDISSLIKSLCLEAHLEMSGHMENHLRIHKPSTAHSFGAINRTVMNEVKTMAQEEGILIDPIYMAKVCSTLRTRRQEWFQADEPVLVIHSGGGLSMCGFWDKLKID